MSGRADTRTIRAAVAGAVQGVGFREATRRRALALGVQGWVRNAEDGTVVVHAEGPPPAIDELIAFLHDGPRGAAVGEHAATTRHFDLRLEVAGMMRSWAVPKGPSLDPAVKRLAVEVADHELDAGTLEGPSGGGATIVWDRGPYEQGGRVPWPQALERGHAVFVLHGQKLRGGFALQRTRPEPKAQWLLLKRRDEHARDGYDVVTEQPASVLSGRTLEQLLAGADSG